MSKVKRYRWEQVNDDWYEVLLRPDGTDVTMITEPEDRTGYRDLAAVAGELNKQANRITELEAEVEHWQATAQRLKHQLIIDSEDDDDE